MIKITDGTKFCPPACVVASVDPVPVVLVVPSVGVVPVGAVVTGGWTASAIQE